MIWAKSSGADRSSDCVGCIVEAVNKVKDSCEDDDGKNQILEFEQIDHSL